jgi:hypothetical protein
MYNQRLAADRWGLATNQEVEVCIPSASEINHRGVIYTFQLSHIRSEAVSPGNGSPVLMLRADCSCFTLEPAHSSPYLPTGEDDYLLYEDVVNWVNIRTNRTQYSKIEIKNRTELRIDRPMSL